MVVRVGHKAPAVRVEGTIISRLRRPIRLKTSRYRSAQRALWYREGGGWWHVRPRMLCVPSRKSSSGGYFKPDPVRTFGHASSEISIGKKLWLLWYSKLWLYGRLDSPVWCVCHSWRRRTINTNEGVSDIYPTGHAPCAQTLTSPIQCRSFSAIDNNRQR